MKRLRHPIRSVREPFGTAGLIVACVALIAALSGSAIAASGALTGKQKKEVTKIAKKFAGKNGAQGPAGPQGSIGTQGPKGNTGASGANGTDGTPGKDGTDGKAGTNGESVNIFELEPGNGEGCEETGGAKFANGTGVAFACNGEGGEGGGGWPQTLPSGDTMTGAWELQGESGIVAAEIYGVVNIGYPLPLDEAPTEAIAIFQPGSHTPEENAKCPGSSDEPSAAAPGVLCLYAAYSAPDVPEIPLLLALPKKYGATLYMDKTYQAFGTWAVMAP